MKNIDVLWEGNLLLYNINWNARNVVKCNYFQEYEHEAKKNWSLHIKKHPNDYDGTLLFLENFSFKDNQLDLEISLFKFSMANYLLKQKIPLSKGYGALGTQYLVFSPKKDHILVGQRAKTQSYYPRAINVPGGILEVDDPANAPAATLTRELREEVILPLNSNFNLVAILGGWDNVSVTLLISTTIQKMNFDPIETYPSDNYEWESNLRWLSLKTLEKMPSTNFLDGLTYFQSKLIEKTRSSIKG